VVASEPSGQSLEHALYGSSPSMAAHAVLATATSATSQRPTIRTAAQDSRPERYG
jgi:hypothetical protein